VVDVYLLHPAPNPKKNVEEGIGWRLSWLFLHSSVSGLSRSKICCPRSPSCCCSRRKTLPKELSNKIEFMPHDFFTEQPVQHADVYFFRWIFHNWSDKYCTQILRNLIPALKNGARIVINDNVLPEPGVLPIWREEKLISMDLTMLELGNAKERDLDGWAKLFVEAESRFRFIGGKPPVGSSLWILEPIWEG
jgi:hypothetical protein